MSEGNEHTKAETIRRAKRREWRFTSKGWQCKVCVQADRDNI